MTKFECGGFVLGISFQHCMLDGIALHQFIRAWGETSRGLPITMPPCIDRTILKARFPPRIQFAHPEFMQIKDLSKDGQLDIPRALVTRSFSFSADKLDRMKKKVVQIGGLSKCTKFEVSIDLVLSVDVRFHFTYSL